MEWTIRYFASIIPPIWIITVQNWNKFATAKFVWKYLLQIVSAAAWSHSHCHVAVY